MGSLEGRGIVGAVARNGHDLSETLEGFDQTLLVHRTSTRDNLEVENALFEFLVRECSELRASDDVAIRVGGLPQSDLSANLFGCARSVARYDLDINTSI